MGVTQRDPLWVLKGVTLPTVNFKNGRGSHSMAKMLGGACSAGEQGFRLATSTFVQLDGRLDRMPALLLCGRADMTRTCSEQRVFEGSAKKCQELVPTDFPIVPTGRAALRKYSTGAPTPSAQPINFL